MAERFPKRLYLVPDAGNPTVLMAVPDLRSDAFDAASVSSEIVSHLATAVQWRVAIGRDCGVWVGAFPALRAERLLELRRPN